MARFLHYIDNRVVYIDHAGMPEDHNRLCPRFDELGVSRFLSSHLHNAISDSFFSLYLISLAITSQGSDFTTRE